MAKYRLVIKARKVKRADLPRSYYSTADGELIDSSTSLPVSLSSRAVANLVQLYPNLSVNVHGKLDCKYKRRRELPVPAPHLDSFDKSFELPFEIQMKIWTFAAGKYKYPDYFDDWRIRYPKDAIPETPENGALTTCQLARLMVLKTWRTFFKRWLQGGPYEQPYQEKPWRGLCG